MGRLFSRAISLASVGLIVIVGAGCGSAAGNGAPAGLEKTTLTVGAVPVADEAGLFIAEDDNLFKDEGLDVKIVPIVSSAVATQKQNDGTFDITAGNSVSYIQDQVTRQSNLEIVAEGSLMQPNNQALYTLPGSPLTSITDLGHARIGVNVTKNIGTLLISSVLEEHGVSLSHVQFVAIPNGFPGMATALQKHQIDVAWLPEPFGSMDAMQYGLQEVADLDQGATTSFPVGWYVVTKEWAKKYPRTLTAFLDALQQGQEIADTDRSAVEQAMEKLPKPYGVPPAIAAVMSLENYPLSVAPDIDLSRVQRVADAMYQFHMLTQPFRVSSMLG
jgi:NitT/TauT family transport system substrate-binding protein